MKARLFARFGPEAGREVEFGSRATIGRGQDNTLVLTAPEVSQQHARVEFDPDAGAYYLEDLGSLNGTRLDGVRVGDRERLGALHVLAFGETVELFFQELDRTPGEPEAVAEERPGEGTRIDAEVATLPIGLRRRQAGEGTRIDAEAPILPAGLGREGRPAAAPAGSATEVDEQPAGLPETLAGPAAAKAPPAGEPAGAAPRFVLVLAGEPPERFPLAEGDNLVGRVGRATVRLRARELSRRHATLRVEGDRIWVRDEGSRNHTYVGGRKVRREVELEPGAELRFGTIEARLEPAAEGGDGGGD